jgi:hypothetical protein
MGGDNFTLSTASLQMYEADRGKHSLTQNVLHYESEHCLGCHLELRLSPTGDALRDLNLKWVSNQIPIASNRVTIRKTHFSCQERHNSNLNIIYPEDPFAERVLF